MQVAPGQDTKPGESFECACGGGEGKARLFLSNSFIINRKIAAVKKLSCKKAETSEGKEDTVINAECSKMVETIVRRSLNM